MKLQKLLLINLICATANFVNPQNTQAQCPSNNQVFDNSVWFFCENAGTVDLNTYLNPAYPTGVFAATDPSLASIIINNQYEVSTSTSPAIPFSVEYVVSIGTDICTYPLDFQVVAESPALDPTSFTINTNYCQDDNPFTIFPELLPPGGNVVVNINGSASNLFKPANSNGNDTISILYGDGCFITETYFVTVTQQPIISSTIPDTLYTDQTTYTLTATPAGGEFYINGMSLGLAIDNINPSLYPDGTIIDINYTINGCAATTTQQIVIANPPEPIEPPTVGDQTIDVFIPNIFTPNFDNVNDKLYVRADDIFSLSFKVFNRWGEKVFETTDQAIPWEGFDTEGKVVSAGAYFYQLSYKLEENGVELIKKGDISLIR